MVFNFFLQADQADQTTAILTYVDKIARTPISVVVLVLAVFTLIRLLLFPYISKTPKHKRFGLYAIAKGTSDIFDAFVYAGVFVFLIIRPFIGQTFYVPSGSMLQTLQLKDFLIGNKYVYRFNDPKRGDIVIFTSPKIGRLHPDQVQYIKRLIGVPGDTIEIRNSTLYKNGTPVQEPYLNEKTMATDFKLVRYKGKYWPLAIQGDYVNYAPHLTAPVFRLNNLFLMHHLKNLPAEKIPKDYYLFMGDNRNGSYDGRAWGLVHRNAIIAKAEFIWMPITRIGRVGNYNL